MKIYTKTGDNGTTSLIGGYRVYKDDDQVEAYGTIDELISYLGIIRSYYLEFIEKRTSKYYTKYKMKNNSNNTIGSCIGSYSMNINDVLLNIQDRLMICASNISRYKNANDIELPEINENDIEKLEKYIDGMNTSMYELESFILPGGEILSSHCDYARTICRRSERIVIKFSRYTINDSINIISGMDNEIIIKYLNRLSDFLFTLSRFVNKPSMEIKWLPKM